MMNIRTQMFIQALGDPSIISWTVSSVQFKSLHTGKYEILDLIPKRNIN